MGEKITLGQVRTLIKTAFRDSQIGMPVSLTHSEADSIIRAIDAHLAIPAQTVDVNDAMVERALTCLARQEDGAVWPDAYGADEQAAEREKMRDVLAEAINTEGPKAYCRSCQRVGMSNCSYFDECSGATCITCHRPFIHAIGNAQTVDVEAVKTLLELVEGEHGGDHTEADCRHCVAFNKLAQAIGDKT